MSSPNTNYVTYLIELSQSGRRNAFKDLCEINVKHVYTIIYHLVSDESTARKLTEQVFLLAWAELKGFNVKEAFAVWIKRIAIQYTIKFLSYDISYKKVLDGKVKPESKEKYLDYYLAKLQWDERIILTLSDIEGYSFEEMQKYLPDMLIDEIKSKLINAREFLIKNMSL